ncbi:2-keto-3-deoxygluconate permease, partial [Pseudomonas gingeri]
AAANTAGNAAAVPALIAAANPVYEQAAASATLLVASCVVVTAIVSPVLVSAIAKRVKGRTADETRPQATDGQGAPR